MADVGLIFGLLFAWYKLRIYFDKKGRAIFLKLTCSQSILRLFLIYSYNASVLPSRLQCFSK
jgi:hypothetical protein